ncbi:hypothetical protein Q1695_005898 [Nippostrongylus brasiliensis]|nr:hypothetical protein Q1695_005898 [Nippostrongylus brasiliensis]
MLPPSRSSSPELYILEHVKFLPTPDSTASHHINPFLVDALPKATEVQRPVLRFMEPPDSSSSPGRRRSSAEGRWSEEARKRYAEYKKNWNKYRITKKKSSEEEDQ